MLNDVTVPACSHLRARKHLISTAFLLLTFNGCNSSSHTSNPRLAKIDALLDAQLPKGTPMARVTFYLNSRGYIVEDSQPSTVVAVVHHVDTETLQPSTARITFHFDASNKLVSYELAPVAEFAMHQ